MIIFHYSSIFLQVILSQNGASLLNLHPHISIFSLTSSIVNLIGLNKVPK